MPDEVDSPRTNRWRGFPLVLTALMSAALVGCASQGSAGKEPSIGHSVGAPGDARSKSAGDRSEHDALADEADADSEDADPVEETPPEPAEPEPFPEGTTVLHVGSSSAGALGLELDKMLEERGLKSYLKAKESTFIPQWAGDKMGLRQLLSQYKPDLVLISLGGNETQIPDPNVRAKTIQRLVKLIGDRPCVWIGTPRWKRLRHTGLLEVIRDNAAPCAFIDSDELAPNMATVRDGVHPTYPERHRWAKRVIEWLELNREPHGEKPWSIKAEPTMPPAEPEPDPALQTPNAQ